MQVSVESTTGLERKMKVAVPKERIESEVDMRLKDLVGRVKIDGFRKGKVPVSVVRKKYGTQIRQEVMSDVLQSSFAEAVTQEKLRPAGMPHINEVNDGDNGSLEYTATFEVYPEVKLEGLDKIKVERPVLEIGDADIAKMLENIRAQRKTWQEIDRASQEGDQLTINFVGTINGETFQGGSAEGVPLELGSKRMIEGFEEQLVGAKAGEERTVSVTFPENYHSAELAGKPAEFAVNVTKVEEAVLPELNDDFVKALGVKEGGLDALKQQVRENMEREGKQAIASRLKEQVFSAVMDLNLVELPKALVDAEIDSLVKQRKDMMAQYGGQVQDLDPAEFEDQARRRVSLGLVLSEVIHKNNIKVPPARLRETVEGLASSYEQPEAVVKFYYSDKNRLAEVENIALEEMAVEWLMEQGKVTDKKTSFDELMNPGQTAA